MKTQMAASGDQGKQQFNLFAGKRPFISVYAQNKCNLFSYHSVCLFAARKSSIWFLVIAVFG